MAKNTVVDTVDDDSGPAVKVDLVHSHTALKHFIVKLCTCNFLKIFEQYTMSIIYGLLKCNTYVKSNSVTN